MKLIEDPKVKPVFDSYPKIAREKLLHLRKLVLEAASEIDDLETLEETLKWGEPSYLTKYGSTVRMDWKAKDPEQFAIYFKCTSKLVPTFKKVYGNSFNFEGDRAIVFKLTDEIPDTELKQCISMALRYHKIKHLPLLGA
jgi:hypothetical protein